MDLGPYVALTDHDHAMANAFGLLMCDMKSGAHRAEMTEAQREATEKTGKLGECVVGRYLGQRVNWATWNGKLGETPPPDFVLPDGRIVEVKAVQVHANLQHDYRLPIGPKPQEMHWDLAVLVLLAPPRRDEDPRRPRRRAGEDAETPGGYVRGGITREDFLAKRTVERDWSQHRGPRVWVVPCSQLDPWDVARRLPEPPEMDAAGHEVWRLRP